MNFPEQQLLTYLRVFLPESRLDAVLDEIAQAALESGVSDPVEFFSLAHWLMDADERRTTAMEAVVLVEEVGLSDAEVAIILDTDIVEVERAVAEAWDASKTTDSATDGVVVPVASNQIEVDIPEVEEDTAHDAAAGTPAPVVAEAEEDVSSVLDDLAEDGEEPVAEDDDAANWHTFDPDDGDILPEHEKADSDAVMAAVRSATGRREGAGSAIQNAMAGLVGSGAMPQGKFDPSLILGPLMGKKSDAEALSNLPDGQIDGSVSSTADVAPSTQDESATSDVEDDGSADDAEPGLADTAEGDVDPSDVDAADEGPQDTRPEDASPDLASAVDADETTGDDSDTASSGSDETTSESADSDGASEPADADADQAPVTEPAPVPVAELSDTATSRGARIFRATLALLAVVGIAILGFAVFSDAGQDRLAAQGFDPLYAFLIVVGFLGLGMLLLFVGGRRRSGRGLEDPDRSWSRETESARVARASNVVIPSDLDNRMVTGTVDSHAGSLASTGPYARDRSPSDDS